MYGSTWQEPYGANGYAPNGYAANGYAANGYAPNGYSGYQDASAYGNGYGADPSGRAGQAGWNMPPMPPLPPMPQGDAPANYPDRPGFGMGGSNSVMGNSASYQGQGNMGGSMAGVNGGFTDTGGDTGWNAYEQGPNRNYSQADDRRGDWNGQR